MLLTMEFTHTTIRDMPIDYRHPSNMLGVTLVAIPLAFEHTEYLSIEEKMKNLMKKLWQLMNWQEPIWLEEGKTPLLHLKKV